jgi:adenine-specific DNA-methyltransferase
MNELKKAERASINIADEKRAELKRCLGGAFPEVFAEGSIDFDQLKRVLGDWVDPGKERFGLNWPGKAECMKIIQQPSVATLKPARKESVEFDNTKNLFIEGDNLEVLKLLQKAYFGKIKSIYIDPPYNTGKEFIYPDKYSESLETYLAYTGQLDNEGRRFSANTDVAGRYHSRWLSMMYPRLYLARNLLRDDGAIFVSIDDHEVHNLCSLMNEVFGEENHYATIAWQRRDTPANDAKGLSVTHEYLLVFQKSEEFIRQLLPRSEGQIENYKNPDNDPRGPWIRTSLIRKEVRLERIFPIRNPRGEDKTPPPGTSWRLPPETFTKLEKENRIWWGQDSAGELPFRKKFLSEVQSGVVPVTWWDYKFAGSNRNSKIEIRSIFDQNVPFDTPKPSSLIKRVLKVASDEEGIVLDFFAGSGTTAHAVMELNREDGGNREFILVSVVRTFGAERGVD